LDGKYINFFSEKKNFQIQNFQTVEFYLSKELFNYKNIQDTYFHILVAPRINIIYNLFGIKYNQFKVILLILQLHLKSFIKLMKLVVALF
jgi:hypothetical protein